jgi:hypothetical protein
MKTKQGYTAIVGGVEVNVSKVSKKRLIEILDGRIPEKMTYIKKRHNKYREVSLSGVDNLAGRCRMSVKDEDDVVIVDEYRQLSEMRTALRKSNCSEYFVVDGEAAQGGRYED